MKTYVAVVDSYGFQRRYWTAGDKLELPDDHKCPEYFKLIDELEPVVVEIAPEPNTFSAINDARKDNAPKTGMAYELPTEPKKTGRPPKKK